MRVSEDEKMYTKSKTNLGFDPQNPLISAFQIQIINDLISILILNFIRLNIFRDRSFECYNFYVIRYYIPITQIEKD